MLNLHCPHCHHAEVERSRRRGFWEKAVLRLVRRRPYRCWDCNRRFYAPRTGRRTASPRRRLVLAHSAQIAARVLMVFPLLLMVLPVALGWPRDPAPVNEPGAALTPALPSSRATQPLLRGGLVELVVTGDPSAESLSPRVAAMLAQRQREPAGTLQVSGEVTVNNQPVAGEQTLFGGEVLRTGPGGAARVSVTGRGTLIIGGNSEVFLAVESRFFASLRQGTLGLRAMAAARNFQVQIGNHVVVPMEGPPSSAEIVLASDGAARVECLAGSVGIISLVGPESLFLSPGQTGAMSATGELQIVAGAAPPVSEQPRSIPAGQTTGGGGGKGLVLLGVVGGGAVAAAVALAGKGGSSTRPPLSPSQP